VPFCRNEPLLGIPEKTAATSGFDHAISAPEPSFFVLPCAIGAKSATNPVEVVLIVGYAEPPEPGGANAELPGPIYVVAYVSDGLRAVFEGHLNILSCIVIAFTFRGSLQSTLNVYCGANEPCSRYGKS